MFDPSLENTFVTFGPSHLIAVSVVFFIIAVIIFYKDRIAQSKQLNTLRYTLVALTIGQEISLNIYRIAVGQWELGTSLPFHLCGLGVLTSSFILLT